jgi:hypothetical protein
MPCQRSKAYSLAPFGSSLPHGGQQVGRSPRAQLSTYKNPSTKMAKTDVKASQVAVSDQIIGSLTDAAYVAFCLSDHHYLMIM